MSHFTISFLSLALLLLLFGCTQGGAPQACAGSPSEKLANCVYVSAVLDQNPYSCYSLKDIVQREKCLRDASDSKIQKLVSEMTPADRAKIFSTSPDAPTAPSVPQAPSNVPAANESPAPEIEQPIAPTNGVPEADAQAYAQAVATSDMVPCTTITHAPTRASCITQVAIRVKNPAMCSMFTLKADIDLCNLYAKAGEQAK